MERGEVDGNLVGAISVPLVVPDDANELSVRVVIGGWFLPGESIPEEFEARTAPQPL